MLIFLNHTYRGRTHQWWLQSTLILALSLSVISLTYYFFYLHKQFQFLQIENQRVAPYVFAYRDLPFSARVHYMHEYLDYLDRFEQFEKKAKLAKWIRVYRSKHVLYRQKNDLELVLNNEMVSPVVMTLGKELLAYSQQWENASPLEKNQMQTNFKQSILTYEMLVQHHGYKILSSDAIRQKIIQSWYEFMLDQSKEHTLPSYQALYPKLEKLVEFYFQMPTVKNNEITPDRALLEKYKVQLNI